MSKQSTYGASSITVLKGLEAVRKRPAMYIGDITSRGLHHLVQEVVDNSIDEAMAGHCDQIDITLHIDGSVSVADNGRGIPVDMHATEGKSALEVVMTVLHAGGKFDKDSYKVSGGLHGVGVSVVNALSEWQRVTVHLNGKMHQQSYHRGVPDGPVTMVGDTRKRGTTVTFLPDEQIFQETVFSFDVLALRLRELAFLNKGLKITMTDERGEEKRKEEFLAKGGLVSFVEFLDKSRTSLFPRPIYIEGEKDGIPVEVALVYNSSYNETVLTFTNNINTIEGGTHLTGLRSGLTRTLNKYFGENPSYRKEKFTLSGNDVREGLTCVVSVKVQEPQFEGQTKTKLGNSEVKSAVEILVYEKLCDYFEQNPRLIKAILDKCVSTHRAHDAARKARDLVRRKSALESGSLPGKLADCSLKDPSHCEIYLVEGDSAGGSAKMGRDRRFQAILPLRGKILNVEKARVDKILANEEIKTMVQALGTGLSTEDFEMERLRYHKIIIMTDADVDGSHIRTLLLTFFYRNMNELIRQGFVYIAQPPLYKLGSGKNETYVASEEELKQLHMENSFKKARVLIGGKPSSRTEAVRLLDLSHKLEQALDRFFREVRTFRMIENFLPSLFDMDLARDYLAFSAQHAHSMNLSDSFGEDGFQPEVQTGDHERRLCTHLGIDLAELRSCNVHEFHELVQICDRINQLLKGKHLGIGVGDKKEDSEELTVENPREFYNQFMEYGRKGSNLQRYKGLGEMNPEQLWATTMDPEKRSLVRVTLGDAMAADEMFTVLMGDEVEPRRRFIETNAKYVKNLDV
ncbi:MAG: DNA topoisomerase (ATP-hydrolyzing) subunit B [Calditrichaeota bacterium]|nr:DNA topoisomerase (ATP-hydrolyzing) subunit B [Calditrichota bacterium]MCB9474207.1 DNA topoisomerase (ATP-hydrolyzing) subunit B [Candidatus Delongbacteria bacterium]